MPWCPKCEVEYIDGIKMCSDCHVELEAEYPAEDKPAEISPDELMLAVVAITADEADRLSDMLKLNSIPVVLKTDESLEGGTGIYVPRIFYKRAMIFLMRDDADNTSVDTVDEQDDSFYEDIEKEYMENAAKTNVVSGGNKGLGIVMAAVAVLLLVYIFSRIF